MEIQKNINNKVVLKIVVPIAALLIIYFGMSIYFMNHFCFGSKINGISASGKTVEEVSQELESKTKDYSLKLIEKNDKTEEIQASKINLKYDASDEIKKLKDDQGAFGWIINIFKSKDYELKDTISYDEEKLNATVNSLACFDKKNIQEPVSATLKYENGEYSIVDEVSGNKVDKDVLKDKIIGAILNNDESLNLEESGCYVEPKFKSDSQEVLDAQSELNKYVSTVVNYDIRGNSETLDGSIINKWLTVDENCKVIFDEKQVKNYVYGLASKYDTTGVTKKFKTSTGKEVQVYGGSYGWKIDRNGEAEDLISAVKEGKTINKEPKYSQKGNSNNANDIGNTYVEVNLTTQHLWCYKNGVVTVDTDIVTGNVSANTATPAGIYKIESKSQKFNLQGKNADGTPYTQPVDYWMPFNGGIGLHDANWRNGQFGGDIYINNGSHGCVNCPPEITGKIYDSVEVGTPVICYTE